MNSYADVTTLKSAAYLDYTPTTEDSKLRDLLEQSSRLIDFATNRFFYCIDATRYYDGSASPFWLPDDILSITTLKTDDDDDATFENTYTENTDYRLYPLNAYPKIKARVMSAGSYGGFASGIDKGIEIAGVFGYGDGWSATPYIDSGDDLAAAITSTTTTTTTVDDGDNFAIGQTIRMDTEQCYISGITTNTLTIERGVNGTTAATHVISTTIYIYEYPRPIVQACLITAMRAWKRKDSAYQDVVGGGELGTVITSKGIDPDVVRVLRQYRKYKL